MKKTVLKSRNAYDSPVAAAFELECGGGIMSSSSQIGIDSLGEDNEDVIFGQTD